MQLCSYGAFLNTSYAVSCNIQTKPSERRFIHVSNSLQISYWLFFVFNSLTKCTSISINKQASPITLSLFDRIVFFCFSTTFYTNYFCLFWWFWYFELSFSGWKFGCFTWYCCYKI